MFSTNDCVPAGTFVHVIAGDSPSPGATPGAAWLYFTGIWPPSGNPATVIVIAGAAGAPPACCIAAAAAAMTTNIDVTNQGTDMSNLLARCERDCRTVALPGARFRASARSHSGVFHVPLLTSHIGQVDRPGSA